MDYTAPSDDYDNVVQQIIDYVHQREAIVRLDYYCKIEVLKQNRRLNSYDVFWKNAEPDSDILSPDATFEQLHARITGYIHELQSADGTAAVQESVEGSGMIVSGNLGDLHFTLTIIRHAEVIEQQDSD